MSPSVQNTGSYFAFKNTQGKSGGVKTATMGKSTVKLNSSISSGKAANWAGSVHTQGRSYASFSAAYNSSAPIRIDLSQQTPQTVQTNNSQLSDLVKLQAYMQIAEGCTNVLAKGIDALGGANIFGSSSKVNTKTDAGTVLSNANIISSGDSAAKFETAMENAKNSKDLGAAIDAAIEYQMTLPAQIKQAQQSVTELETFLTNNKGEIEQNNKALKKVEAEKKTAEQSVKSAETGVMQKESGVTQAKRQVDFARDRLAQANAEYKTAKENTDTAQTAVTNQTSVVDNARSNVTRLQAQVACAPNETRADLQSQLDSAKTDLSNQEELLKAKEKALNNAKIEEQRAQEACKKAEAELAEKQKALDEAEEALGQARNTLNYAKKQLKEKTQEYEGLEAKHKEFEDKKQKLADAKAELETLCGEQESLSESITKQRERLSKMYEDENSSIEKLKKKQNEQDTKAEKAVRKGDAEGVKEHENNETELMQEQQTIQENQIQPAKLEELKKPKNDFLKKEFEVVTTTGKGYVNGKKVTYDKEQNKYHVSGGTSLTEEQVKQKLGITD